MSRPGWRRCINCDEQPVAGCLCAVCLRAAVVGSAIPLLVAGAWAVVVFLIRMGL